MLSGRFAYVAAFLKDRYLPILLKNPVLCLDVLKLAFFRSVQLPEINFNEDNYKERHSTCRCGRENLPRF